MNTNDFLPTLPLIKTIQKEQNTGWNSLSKKFRKITVIAGTLLVLLLLGFFCVIYGKQAFSDPSKLIATTLPVPSSQPTSLLSYDEPPTVLGTSNCFTPVPSTFVKADWSGFSWFLISNNVWSLKTENKIETDAVIYYITNCTGNSLVQFYVTPRLEDFININVYLRGQLRWEIGGRDRRSIRLWKNTIGCQSGEIKGAEPLLNMYLPNHDEILIDQPLIINMATYFLKNGKIRNEIWLTYSSKKSLGKEITTPRNSYFYDFEAGSVCDVDHLPNINIEPYQFGLGLQQTNTKTEVESPKLPKVSFDKFKISPFLIIEE